MTKQRGAIKYESILGGKIRTYKSGRKCRYPGCNKILTIYNPSIYCFYHNRIEEVKRIERLAISSGNKKTKGGGK